MGFVSDWINDGFNGIVEAIAITAAKFADDMLSTAFGDSTSPAAWKTVIGADMGTASEGLAGGSTAGLMDGSHGGMLWDIIGLMAPVTVALIAVQALIGMFKRSKAAILRAFVGGILAIPLCLASVFVIHTVDTAVGDFSKNIALGDSASYMEALGYTNGATGLKPTGADAKKSCSALVKDYDKVKNLKDGDIDMNQQLNGVAGDNSADGDRKRELESYGVSKKTKCGWHINEKRTDIWGEPDADGSARTGGLLYGSLLSVLAAFGGVVLKCVMFFRALALLLLSAFAPVALMVLPFEGTKGWSVKWAEMVVGLILAQPASAVVFALSMKLAGFGGNDPSAAVMGIAGMLMSAVAPFVVLKFLSFSPVAATSDLNGGAGRAAGGIVRGGTAAVRGVRGAGGGVGQMTRSVTRRK